MLFHLAVVGFKKTNVILKFYALVAIDCVPLRSHGNKTIEAVTGERELLKSKRENGKFLGLNFIS